LGERAALLERENQVRNAAKLHWLAGPEQKETGKRMPRKPIKWRAESLKRQKLLGFADLAAREIVVDVNAHGSERELLDTICHELLHVSSGDMLSEKAVDLMAQDLASVLYRMKWRRVLD